jgi:hypothetical protein
MAMKHYVSRHASELSPHFATASNNGFTIRKQTRSASFDLQPLAAMRRLLADARSAVTVMGFILAALVLLAPPAHAKGGVPPVNGITVGLPTAPGGPVPFDITGAIESLIRNDSGANSGGVIVVNGTKITIPTNLVVTLPAAYMTVGQLFDNKPLAATNSGLALADLPIAAFEASIAGNIMPTGEYIAGLVSIAQQGLNASNGYIRAIDYTTGVLCVGGLPVGPCAATDARVVINDPVGRYGLANTEGGKAALSMDGRFSVDSDNPTIHAASGYPMCVPRVAPPAIDAKCPIGNRPANLTTFVMDPRTIAQGGTLQAEAPFAGTVAPCGSALPNCDVKKQAPLMVGDYIGYSGILAKDAVGTIYETVFALEANVGIFTPLRSTIFYMYLDAPLIASGPAICPGNAECQARMRTTIFSTDLSTARLPAVFAVDENPATGVRTSRQLPSTVTNTAQLGRYVIVTDKDTRTLGLAGGGVTREFMARVATVADGTQVFYGTSDPTSTDPKILPSTDPRVAANGLVYGQYVSPGGEYIFPEPNISGGVLTPYNFRCLAFLANGWSQGGALTLGQLSPFPELTAPIGVNCTN